MYKPASVHGLAMLLAARLRKRPRRRLSWCLPPGWPRISPAWRRPGRVHHAQSQCGECSRLSMHSLVAVLGFFRRFLTSPRFSAALHSRRRAHVTRRGDHARSHAKLGRAGYAFAVRLLFLANTNRLIERAGISRTLICANELRWCSTANGLWGSIRGRCSDFRNTATRGPSRRRRRGPPPNGCKSRSAPLRRFIRVGEATLTVASKRQRG